MTRIFVTHDNYPAEAIEWCKEHFGPTTGNRWYYDARIFYFYSDKDATLFRLRWS